jgi:hypothetical protein
MTQVSPLLQLPGEIRNYIVEYVMTREPGMAPPSISKSPLALSSTCLQLHNEFRSLAWHLTIFPIRWSSAQQLATKASILPPASASSIKKLQIQLPCEFTELYTDDPNRRRVKPFGFAEAGLTGLEELYFRYRPEHHEKGVGGPGRELLVQTLWRLLWERGIESLKRVCVVHDGTQPFLSFNLLYGMLKEYGPLRRSRRWSVTSDLEHGQIIFREHGHGGDIQKQVSVVVGYSFREAEEYLEVCEQILDVSFEAIVRWNLLLSQASDSNQI